MPKIFIAGMSGFLIVVTGLSLGLSRGAPLCPGTNRNRSRPSPRSLANRGPTAYQFGGRITSWPEVLPTSWRPASSPSPSRATGKERLEEGFAALAAFLSAETAAGRRLPESMPELADRWRIARPAEALPVDPYDGEMIGYALLGEEYVLFSSGPDGVGGTDDDIPFRSEAD